MYFKYIQSKIICLKTSNMFNCYWVICRTFLEYWSKIVRSLYVYPKWIYLFSNVPWVSERVILWHLSNYREAELLKTSGFLVSPFVSKSWKISRKLSQTHWDKLISYWRSVEFFFLLYIEIKITIQATSFSDM